MNRNVSDVSWYEFGRILEYKSVWNSKHFMKIDRYFPSTQLCSSCGSRAHLLLKDRVYVCPNCKEVLDRDYNASLNILKEGIKRLKISNTVATTGLQACGTTSTVKVVTKQEKLSLHQSVRIGA